MGKTFDRNQKQSKFKGKKLSTNALIAEREKTTMFHKYKKMLTKERKKAGGDQSEQRKPLTAKILEEVAAQSSGERDTARSFNKSRPPQTTYQKVQNQYENKQKEKEKKDEELEKRKEKVEEAMKKHKKSRKEHYHNLCKKTSHGQIRMGAQIETLLKKIEESKNK